MKWTKTGGHSGSRMIKYTSDCGRFEIYKNLIGGAWTMPVLFDGGKYVRGYERVATAKAVALSLSVLPKKKEVL